MRGCSATGLICVSKGELGTRTPGSLEIAFHHGDEIVSGFQLGRKCLLTWDKDMESKLALDQLRHQPIQCTSAGSDELQNFFALVLSGKSPLDRFDLALNATDPAQHLFFVLAGVQHVDLLQKIIYSPIVPVKRSKDYNMLETDVTRKGHLKVDRPKALKAPPP